MSAEAARHRLPRRAADFLPLLLALLLALATTWLVRNAPSAQPAAAAPPSTQADYFMHHFVQRQFNAQGQLENAVRGQHAWHIPGGDLLHMRQVQAVGISAQGVLTHTRAQRALSDARGQRVELSGDVQLQRIAPSASPEAPTELHTQHLLVLHGASTQAQTDQAVRITRGNSTLQGTGLRYNSQDAGHFELGGRVQALIPAAH